jgi:thiol:disulfide interchange protein DsbG
MTSINSKESNSKASGPKRALKFMLPAAMVVGLALVSIAAFLVTGPESPRANPGLSKANAAVAQLSHGKFSAVSTFSGPSDNIVGVRIGPVADKKAPKAIVWMVDGKYIMAGQLFDASGKNLTDAASTEANMTKSPEEIAALALQSKGFVEGTSGPLMVSFEDPNCMFCHKFSESIENALAAGQLRVKVVPVGFLKGEDSLNRAAAVLQAASPEKAWADNMKNFDAAHELGGLAPAKPTPDTLKALSDNLDLLRSTGKVATPTLIFCRKGDKTPELFSGIPQEFQAILKNPAELTSVKPDGTCAKP